MAKITEAVVTGQDLLENFLERLVDYVDLDPQALDTFTGELCTIYSDKEFRHSYAEISLVIEKLSPDQRDALSSHITAIRSAADAFLKRSDKEESQSTEIKKRIFKLCDHIDLECLRIARIDRVEYIGKTASNELSAADGKLRETEERAKELDKRVSQYHDQSIAILGIFAGLVVTFSGAIQFLSSSFENLSDASAMNITLFVSLSFFFLFNVIFLLMYCISKIAGKSIASNCESRNCESCHNCKTFLGRMKKKYPFVFWYNFVGAILCGVLCFIAK